MIIDVIIVGAGLSGLVAARELQTAGKSVVVLDKGRSVGGRLATRRIGNGIADHGAQFFTVRTEEFQQQVDQWLTDDLITVWGHGWSDGSLKRTAEDGHPRYIAKAGMNSIAKSLAKSLTNIQVNTKVGSITREDDRWIVRASDGVQFEAKALIMTPPVPQTLELIKGVSLSDEEQTALKRIKYGPALCGLFAIEGNIDLPEPGALQNFDNPIYWIADNTRKGISPDEHIITLHAEARYSRSQYDAPDEETLTFMRKELQNYLAKGTTIKSEQLKKWRYSVPLTTYPHDVLKAERLPLIFAGDAFGGRGRVEGAFMSGLAAGKTAIELV